MTLGESGPGGRPARSAAGRGGMRGPAGSGKEEKAAIGANEEATLGTEQVEAEQAVVAAEEVGRVLAAHRLGQPRAERRPEAVDVSHVLAHRGCDVGEAHRLIPILQPPCFHLPSERHAPVPQAEYE